MHQDYTVVVLVETETKVERIQSMLNEMHIPTVSNIHEDIDGGQVVVTEGSLSEGFELPYAVGSHHRRELFKTDKKKQRKRTKTISNAENKIISRPKCGRLYSACASWCRTILRC